MSSAQKLFRKAALEKLSSPEQLDIMMKITSPTGWLALCAIGLGLVGVVLWGIFGSIATKVAGQGILLRDAVQTVTAGSQGRLTEVIVRSGSVVEAGETIARIAQADLESQINRVKSELADLRSQSRDLKGGDAELLSSLEQQLGQLRARRITQRGQLERGLITRSQILQTDQAISGLQQQIRGIQAGGTGMQNQIAERERTLGQLEEQLAALSVVTSPYTGRVLEVAVSAGDVVGPGMPLIRLETFDKPIEALVYIPAADGKKVKEGMQVRVSPTTVKTEEYGFMIGVVKSVSEFPVSRQAMVNTLGDETLAQQLGGKQAPIEVVASLIEDESTPSGFRWSSSSGPPSKVFTGTIATGQVVVEEKRPISLVLPIFKKAVGAG